ncbi:MAG TPA: multifunctional CCA addition/repair protein [Arenimonas sp.]|uniref:multifunctional CCA addition/repair protein n=1 Tax=Arenimonas sp. TaxID=1872635 RepID=UPI002CA6BB82|nr:multifunctional CCA addition/repair protein [Arenimonas sp.]HMB57595.1 multifunctional CCA addition/repair protein [Arenimonas sp.]
MRIYLVGGAVRDRLLGRDGGDRDYVVVGATPERMLADGFKPVGKDFPVFLHPRSGEEYALARTERKTAPGYHGFVFHADESVTLEDDLARRDFTINAIAEADDGTLVDPFGGVQDIERRVLRHVSPAFAEDPVRILRGARFLARFAAQGFTIAPETLALMRDMVAAGEVDHLVPERVWQEMRKALAEAMPSAFIGLLRDCGALKKLLSEVDALFGVPQRVEFHPEVDAGVHTQMVCDMAARLAPGNARIGFAALTHDLGKALTPTEILPKHIEHERAGLVPVRALCERYKVPNDFRELAVIACREHLNVHRLDELRPETVHDLIARCDGFRQPERIAELALVCAADKRGRLGLQESDYPQAAKLVALQQAALAVTVAQIDISGLQGPDIGIALRKARIAAIENAR